MTTWSNCLQGFCTLLFALSTFHAGMQPKKPVQRLIRERVEAALAGRGEGALTWDEICEMAKDYVSKDALVTIQDFSVQLALLHEMDGWRKNRQELSRNIKRCKEQIERAVLFWFVRRPFSRCPCPVHSPAGCDYPGELLSQTDTARMMVR